MPKPALEELLLIVVQGTPYERTIAVRPLASLHLLENEIETFRQLLVTQLVVYNTGRTATGLDILKPEVFL